MAEIILVTGGSRSGKSDYAQKRAEGLNAPRCFVATSVATDQEMVERIKKHQQVRDDAHWDTIEEPLYIDKIFSDDCPYKTVLIDCLTLWISNIMLKYSQQGQECDEAEIQKITKDLMQIISQSKATIIMVTNEVGMGIVPENTIARRYRDLVGRCNQIVASFADEVIMVSCGLPLRLK